MRTAFPLLALAAISAPVSAAAPGVDEVVTVRIALGDLDLSSAAGRAKLEERVETRLREACTIESNSRYGYGRDIVDEKCVADARAAALAKAEQVAAARSRTGGEVAAN